MDPDSSILLQLLFLAVLILINAFFAASEIAVIQLNDNKLKKLKEDGNKKAALLSRMLNQPSRFLATIQVGVTLSGFLASAVAANSFADRLVAWIVPMGVPSSFVPALEVLVLVVITLLLSYFTLVFGELVPKRIAMQKTEKLALAVSGSLNIISKIFKPFVTLLAFSTNSVVRMTGIDPDEAVDKVTEEEIRLMVDVGEETGEIEEIEKNMINNVFEFDDRAVIEVMTHRTDMSAASVDASISDILNIAITEGYSRIPLYEEDIDSIIGILFVKDLLKYVGETVPDDLNLRSLMRPANFVPETNTCIELFKEMVQSHSQMAIVLDEYGGTSGVVTMEDLIESIVGNIRDEYDNEEEEFSQIDECTFGIEGSASISDVEQMLDTALPEGDYDTIAGLIVDLLGKIPQEGEHPEVTVDNYVFRVLSIEDRHIKKVLAIRNPSPPEDENPEETEEKHPESKPEKVLKNK